MLLERTCAVAPPSGPAAPFRKEWDGPDPSPLGQEMPGSAALAELAGRAELLKKEKSLPAW